MNTERPHVTHRITRATKALELAFRPSGALATAAVADDWLRVGGLNSIISIGYRRREKMWLITSKLRHPNTQVESRHSELEPCVVRALCQQCGGLLDLQQRRAGVRRRRVSGDCVIRIQRCEPCGDSDDCCGASAPTGAVRGRQPRCRGVPPRARSSAMAGRGVPWRRADELHGQRRLLRGLQLQHRIG